MSVKRVISVVLLVVMCAALLAGCKDYSNLAPGEPFSALQKLEVKCAVEGEISFVDDGGFWMYFGVYDGAKVIYSGDGGALQVLTNVSVGGYYFTFPTSHTPIVIYRGKTYLLKDAYEKGVLTKDAIRQIYTYFGSEAYQEAKIAAAMNMRKRIDAEKR